MEPVEEGAQGAGAGQRGPGPSDPQYQGGAQGSPPGPPGGLFGMFYQSYNYIVLVVLFSWEGTGTQLIFTLY